MKPAIKVAMSMAGLLFALNLPAAQIVYPAKGQTPEQQQKDESECNTWATKNSGFDPAKPQAAPAPAQPTGPSGARLRGAAAGAAVGAITDNDKGDAALAGAVGAGVAERGGRRRANQQQQQSVANANKEGMATYEKARAACLEGRGYTVK